MRNVLILLATTLVLVSCSAVETEESEDKPGKMYLLDFPIVGLTNYSSAEKNASSTETTNESVNEPANETANETASETANETANETVSKPVEETVKENVSKPANETANITVSETVSKPVDEPVKEAVNKPANVAANETVKAAAKKTVKKAKRVRIVAIEPPPLRLQEGWTLQHVPSDSIGAANGLAEVGGIVILAEAPAVRQPAAQAPGSPHGSAKNLWIPSAALADEAASQLQVAGWTVERSAGLRSPPGMMIGEYDLRGKDVKEFYYDNWLSPILLWYKADQSSFDYGRETVQAGELSIEVALRSFEAWPETRFADAQLRISVFIKVVDPGTSRTLNRATCGGIFESSIGSDDQAFANDGKILKEVFARRGQQLVHECLSELKLLSHG
ncbi:MAG TPA: hypothetical protein VEG37_02820 [Burkholderiales bacterium]|nr:hypothetical protein [Burkholderiales bacterium]